ncbi:MAG: hypothetical protein Q4D47_00615 [Erysipelotrichaceae bacterium]|nr:hypothetical protein [Erysipelotrichaceae bacterium]
MITLPEYIKKILTTLNTHNYEAFVVGGSIRNALLNLPIVDYDITTNAKPHELLELFKDYPCLTHGMKHGTITIIVENHPVEVTTYRIEGNYINHRFPSTVEFTTSLQEDCRRRDFTINALCYHPDTGILDYFNGLKDLHHQCIRCIDDPFARFEEDALRILRAIRFASQLHFTIENTTKQAIFEKQGLLNHISNARLLQEANQILCSQHPAIFLDYPKILYFLFQVHTMDTTMNHLPNLLPVRLAHLLKDHKDYKTILKQRQYDKKTIKQVDAIIHQQHNPLDQQGALTLLQNYPKEYPLILQYLCSLHGLNYQNELDKLHTISIYDVKHLAIRGKDLPPSIEPKQRSIVLNTLLDLVINKEINNTKEDLLDYIKNNIQ